MPETTTTTPKCRACIEQGIPGECTDPAHQVAPEIGLTQDADPWWHWSLKPGQADAVLQAVGEILAAANPVHGFYMDGQTAYERLSGAVRAAGGTEGPGAGAGQGEDLRDAIARALAAANDDGVFDEADRPDADVDLDSDEDVAWYRKLADAVLPAVQAHVAAEETARGWAKLLDEFHRRPGCDVPQPAEPSIDVPGVLNRLKYIEDEVAELREAVEAGDLPGALKEIADVVYTLYGMAWRCRLPLDEAVREVHRSNMTKTASPDDGKAIKGPDYSPADMAAVLAAAGEQRG